MSGKGQIKGEITIRSLEKQDIPEVISLLKNRSWIPFIQLLIRRYLFSTKAIAVYVTIYSALLYIFLNTTAFIVISSLFTIAALFVYYILPGILYGIYEKELDEFKTGGLDNYWIKNSSEYRQFWVATLNNRVIGCVGMKELPKNLYKYTCTNGSVSDKNSEGDNTLAGNSTNLENPLKIAYVCRMAISLDCSRKGIGRQLMAELFDFCKVTNYNKVMLETNMALTVAVNFYRKLGFTIEERGIVNSVAMSFDL